MLTFSIWAILMIMELIVYAISHSLKIYVQLSSGAEGLVFGLSLHLPLYFLHGSSEGSGKTAHLRSLVKAITACLSNKHQSLMRWIVTKNIIQKDYHTR